MSSIGGCHAVLMSFMESPLTPSTKTLWFLIITIWLTIFDDRNQTCRTGGKISCIAAFRSSGVKISDSITQERSLRMALYYLDVQYSSVLGVLCCLSKLGPFSAILVTCAVCIRFTSSRSNPVTFGEFLSLCIFSVIADRCFLHIHTYTHPTHALVY